MRVPLGPFIGLSALGLVLSLVVHLSSLLGVPISGAEYAWGLHVGIFVVWLPAVLVSQRLVRNVKPNDYWRAALRGCPLWMRRMTQAFLVYAFINFFLFLATTFGRPSEPPDSGTPATVFLGFSGHWMAFYSAALAILYSAKKVAERGGEATCPNGHPVSPFARFCEECGAPVATDGETGSSGEAL